MKKLLAVAIVFSAGIAAHAQCNKTITWTGSKTEYLDVNETVQKTQNAPIAIQTTNSHITVNFTTDDGRSDIIEGEIKNITCNWNDAFKNGKTSFKSVLTKSNGETKEATISIEAKEGKISIIVELENMNGMKMRIPVDSYKEQV